MGSKFLAVFGFAVALALPGLAQGAVGFNGVGGQVSFVSPEELDGTFGLGVQADLGEIGAGVAIYPSIAFWRKSEDYDVGFCEGDISFTEIAFNADVRYYFLGYGEGSVRPFAGGGLALVYGMSSWDWTCDDPWLDEYTEDDSDSDMDIGFNILGGTDFPISESVAGFVEARFKVDGFDTFKLTGGATFQLGG